MRERVIHMAGKRDYYEVLGVDRNADAAAIKKAYRKLAKKYHPDTNAGNQHAEQMFKEVTEAYEVLSDPEKKKLYDRFGHAAFDGSAGQSAYGGTDGAGGFQGFRTAQEAFRDSTVSRVLTETADTGNFILKAAIWVTFSAIFLETFSMEATAFMEGEARAREAAFIRAASEISAAGRRARI